MESTRSINLLDKTFAHTPTGQICDFYKSDKIEWDRYPVLSQNITVVTDSEIPNYYNYNQNLVALLLEPRELLPQLYKFVENFNTGFSRILTHDAQLSKLPNAKQYTFGGCWIEPNDVKVWDKSKNVSIIASGKRITTGHRLRHSVIGRLDKMDVYGRGYNPVDKKIEALRDYRFSVTIENVDTDNFFTEKLIDCFATGTVPIYWGMPSIAKYFNGRGIIKFNSIRELDRILQILDEEPEHMYESMKDAVLDNFERCKRYFATEDSIYESLKDLL